MLPAGALLAAASGSRVMRRSEMTGPPFCERPVWSSPETFRPSSRAAMPSIWFTVTTPVPPMPIIRTPKSSCVHEPARLGQLDAERRHLVLRLLARHDGDERGTVALEAGEVLVAGGLVDVGLAAELGLDRDHREARGLLAAVAAALAYALVDPDALLRLRGLAALAVAAQLGGALLVVDQDGHALDLGELLLRGEQLLAVAHLGDRRQLDAAVVAQVLGRDDDPPRRPRARASGSGPGSRAGPRSPGRPSSRRARCRAACR